MLRRLAVLFCLAALVAIIPAYADQWDKQTKVTFARAIELPGIVLPAGTYVFRLLDVPGDRHVVQVFNADATHLYTTILAIPNYRLTPTAESVMRFNEAPRGRPEPMRAWFYPGDNFGQEFVYPKKRAAEIAEVTHVPVLSAEVTPAEQLEELAKAPVETIAPVTREAAPSIEELPVIAEAQPAPEAAAPEAPAAPAAELPKTASPLPMLMLIGFGSLGLALGLRAVAIVLA